MCKAVSDNMKSDGKSPFTIGIQDDVSHLSLSWQADFLIDLQDTDNASSTG